MLIKHNLTLGIHILFPVLSWRNMAGPNGEVGLIGVDIWKGVPVKLFKVQGAPVATNASTNMTVEAASLAGYCSAFRLR